MTDNSKELATADSCHEDFEATKRLAAALGVDIEGQNVTEINISIRAGDFIHIRITKELFRDEYVEFVEEMSKYKLVRIEEKEDVRFIE